MSDDAPCCGACAHALEVEARGGPEPTTAPLVHAPVVDGIPRGIAITIIAGRDLGRAITLDKPEIVVGRTSGADVQIDDVVISRRQCRFVFRDSHAYVRVPADLVDRIVDSVNGTTHGDVELKIERARA